MEKVKTIVILILAILVILGGIFIINQIKANKESEEQMQDILKNVQEEKASLTEYVIYGTHLNLKGEIEEKKEEVKNINLILKNLEKTQEKIKLNYKKENGKIKFETGEIINEGIDLEKIELRKNNFTNRNRRKRKC